MVVLVWVVVVFAAIGWAADDGVWWPLVVLAVLFVANRLSGVYRYNKLTPAEREELRRRV